MEKWQAKAEELFGEALDLPREQRGAFLDAACRGAPDMRRAVESLLAENDRLSGFLSESPYQQVKETASTATATHLLEPRTRLGRYLILDALGSGGMGVVYRARDEKLERVVAIKMLAPGVLSGEQARRHFRREALALAKLNHPRIAAVYDVGEQDGADFIVMELVEGESLAVRLRAGALGIQEATAIALQVAEALEEAHAHGVIHRDLKPANVMITPKGNAKVLDFGVAKMLALETDATISLAETGVLLGTPLYMSPEQALGRKVDARTDLWSLGVLYYESLAGRPPFQRSGSLAVLHAITGQPPVPLREIQPSIPLLAEHVVARALEKDCELRYQHAADLRTDLQRLMREFSDKRSTVPYNSAVVTNRTTRKRGTLWLGAGAVAVVAALAAAVLATPRPVTEPLDSMQITFSGEYKQGPLLTDGARLYFQSRNIPSEMATSGGIIAPIPGLSAGMYLVDASADGSKVLVWTADLNDETGRGWLLAGSSLGGGWRKITSHQADGIARWAPDGKSIYFVDSHQVFVMDADGGSVRSLWKPPAEPVDLELSPDGKEISITLASSVSRLWRMGSDGKNPHALELNWPADADESSGLWTPDGRHFVFNSDREGRGNIYEVVAPRWFAFWQKPEPVRITGNQVNITDAAPARDSRSLFVLGRVEMGTSLVFDPRSRSLVPFLGGLSALAFVVSPDRQWMAYTEYPSGHLWRSRLDGSEAVQLTNTPAYMEQWSPDGKWIAYSDWRKIYRVSAEGGASEKLMESGDNEVMPTWFPDGKSIAFNRFGLSDNPDGMYVVDLASRKVTPMAGAEKYYVAAWSPDGKYLVAMAREPLRMMIYAAATGQWRELRRFDAPWGYYAWTPDSRYIYFDQTQTSPGMYRLLVPSGAWERISDVPSTGSTSDAFVSVTADGQPAVMNHTGIAQVYSLQWR